jgi:hypothetical protein
MVSSGILRLVALVRTDDSEELGVSFIKVTRIGELGTTPAVTSNRRMLTGLCITKFYTSRSENDDVSHCVIYITAVCHNVLWDCE